MSNQKKNQRRETLPYSDLHGKIPPQAQEVEKAVLGALLFNSDSILLITNILNASMFYNDSHSKIYACIEEMASKSEAIDIFTVCERLRKKGWLDKVGGAFYVTDLTNTVATASNIEFHARIIAQKYIARKIIENCSIAISQGYSEEIDIFEIVDSLGNGLVEINNIMNGANEIDWRKETEKQVIDMHKKSAEGITSTGIKIGLNELDKAIAGLREGFYVIGGRPSMGKTAFALDIAVRLMQESKKYVGFFSLEMPTSQLINRLLARETQIDQTRLINCNINAIERNNLIFAGGKVSELPLLVNDNPSISILQIQSQAKVWASKYDLSAIFIDYLQLVKGNNSQRHLEVGEISRGCKILSKILKIPVIALCQLGREKDAGKSLPQLSELRESGSIEQDADTVLLLYRPEYYGIELDSNNESTKGLTKVIIPKNRNGSVHISGVNLRGNLAINKYYEWDSFNELEAKPKDMRTIRNDDSLPF